MWTFWLFLPFCSYIKLIFQILSKPSLPNTFIIYISPYRGFSSKTKIRNAPLKSSRELRNLSRHPPPHPPDTPPLSWSVWKAPTAIVVPGPRDGTKSSVPKWSNDTSPTMTTRGEEEEKFVAFSPSILEWIQGGPLPASGWWHCRSRVHDI